MTTTTKTSSAYYDFMNMVENSWTFDRMTDDERGKCFDALHFANSQGAVKGTYNARWMILQAIYNAFLQGLGYTGGNWRETDADAPF